MRHRIDLHEDNARDEVSRIMADPAASYWLKDALRAALRRDPLDAARDAACLAKLLTARAAAAMAAEIRATTAPDNLSGR